MRSVPACKVLIVDDHPFQRAYLRELFSEHGVTSVYLAKEGESALRLLEQESFSLILSDLMMPGLDGVQLIQRLAGLECSPPLAIMSALPRRMMLNVSNVARMLGIDIIGQIAKPVTPVAIRELLELLEGFRRKRKAERRPLRVFEHEVLEQALAEGQFQAWFQPKRHLPSGRIFAAEALVRWRHPCAGLLLPGEFLTELERHGLEQALLFHMLERAVDVQVAWQKQGFSIKVSLNLPSHLLEIADLPDKLLSRVRSMGGCPGMLVLELTESSTTRQASCFHAAACRLRMMGFGLSLDDFGKGYSSFANWIRTPFTEVKIDRSMVLDCAQDRACASALESIIDLAGQLGAEVVAEGVEQTQQLELLARIGCHFAQGFLIAPALPEASFLQMLREDSFHGTPLRVPKAPASLETDI
ncbi:TPA: EAL domain-containing response regulator [Pseudomonas aeruginosa]